MSVRMIEPVDGGARHEEAFQNPVFHGLNGFARNTLVVVPIPAIQIDSGDLFHGGVEGDRQELREDLLAHGFREGLSLALVFLAMSLNSVAEDLMEEDTRSFAGEDRRSYERFRRGRG